MSRKLLAWALVLGGGAVAVVGVALVYLPAALVVLGGALAAYGLVVVDVDGKP